MHIPPVLLLVHSLHIHPTLLRVHFVHIPPTPLLVHSVHILPVLLLVHSVHILPTLLLVHSEHIPPVLLLVHFLLVCLPFTRIRVENLNGSEIDWCLQPDTGDRNFGLVLAECATLSELCCPLLLSLKEQQFMLDIFLKQLILAQRGVELNDYNRTDSTFINIPNGHEKIFFNEQNHFSCETCGKCLKTKRNLENHIHLHFPTNEFSCDFCGKLFSTEHQLMKHKYSHQKRYECKICLKNYATKQSLARHKIQHQPGGLPKEHLCEICGYLSDNLKDLKLHNLSVHLHKKRYICDICGGGYLNSHKFTSHMATHSEDKRFICALCDRCFKRRDDVKHHITRVHPKTMGLQKEKSHCSLCEKVYNSKEGLMKHMVRQRTTNTESCASDLFVVELGGVQFNDYSRTKSTINVLKDHEKMLFNRQDNFSCETCGKCLKSKRSFVAHIHLHFPTNEFSCDFCGKLFSTEYQLRKHKYSHQKRYECKICFKSYTVKCSLVKHKMQHQPGELPKEHLCEICGYLSDNLKHLKSHISSVHLHKKRYICDVCGGGYLNSHKFTSHMAAHSEDKRFICEVCDRCFKRRDDVKHHITRVHPKTMGLQKEKLHCSLCEKVYTTKEGLMKHMVRHSGERKFVCDLCGKRFMHLFDLSKHKKSGIHKGNSSNLVAVLLTIWLGFEPRLRVSREVFP
uniref:C2H2-type domain-containing protein n=1 Tax=Timema cristinae TaxID=61476 RepID=A0A7R9CWD5_TIMCR|nr:unnamed protein product [Timema cristinae]